MGIFSSEDTVQGKIIGIEVKTFRNMTAFNPKMPKIATLVKIQDAHGNVHNAFFSGEADVKQGQGIVCAIKKTWSGFWIFHNNGESRVMNPELTLGAGKAKTVYRQIGQYQIIN